LRDRIIRILPESWPGEWLIPDASVVWLLSLLVVYAFSIKYACKNRLSPRLIAIAGLWGIIGALWGGHWVSVFATWPSRLEDLPRLLQLMQGDKGVCGALLGAAFCGWLYLLWKRSSFLLYADAAAPAVALGYAFARMGCFLNGCCFGTLSDLPWAMRFPEITLVYVYHLEKGWLGMSDGLSLPVHPTQLYHAGLGLVIFLTLNRWQGKWAGSRAMFGLALYGFIRFWLQGLRGDSIPVVGFLDINQVFSIIFFLSAGILWWKFGRQKPVVVSNTAALNSVKAVCRKACNAG
jgi:phosphatidylglycerol:prolipoprotein diacylglycerol transferase